MKTERKIELLKRIRARIAMPYAWCKYELHKRKVVKGVVVEQSCLLGALDDEVSLREQQPIRDIMYGSNTIRHHGSVVLFNDSRNTKKKDVLSFLDSLIATVGGDK